MYRKVTKLCNRHSEYIYNIKSNNKLDLQLTDNHKLFLFEKKNFTKQNRKLSFHEKGEWISIDDNIDSKKHYTSFIPNQEINDTEYIDLFDLLSINL
jgi:exonuclease V gamma subunit